MTIIDMHIHLKLRSRCSNLSVKDLHEHLSPIFNGVCFTDHWLLKPKKVHPFKKVKVFHGVEITCKLGDILAYGIKSIPLRNDHVEPEKVITRIHDQGGVAVCAHPFTNRHEGFGDHVFDHEFDALEINGALNKDYHLKAKKAARKMNLPLIGGSDAHSIRQLNTFGTKFEIPIYKMEDIVQAIKKRKCKAIKI